MLSDIEIAQQAKMQKITDVAAKLGIGEDDIELYGKYKAKLSYDLIRRVEEKQPGKLILVTAITPTPAGEGKSTTTVGLAQGMHKLGKRVIVALREPSLGPCMGIKGGAAGGGYSQVVPMEDINLHFTGDFHAITSAHMLLSAMLDNHIQQGNVLNIDPRRIVWKRVVDMNDRELRNIVVGLAARLMAYRVRMASTSPLLPKLWRFSVWQATCMTSRSVWLKSSLPMTTAASLLPQARLRHTALWQLS